MGPRVGPVVAPCAEISALRYARVRADLLRRQIIDPDLFTDPHIIANVEPRGKLDVNPLLGGDVTANTSTKRPKEPSPPTRPWKPRGQKDARCDDPRRVSPARCASFEVRVKEEISAHGRSVEDAIGAYSFRPNPFVDRAHLSRDLSCSEVAHHPSTPARTHVVAFGLRQGHAPG